MHKENILALADFIERAEYEFDMSIPRAKPACGSAGCIGGHAAVLWPDLRVDDSNLEEDATLSNENNLLNFTWNQPLLQACLDITQYEHKILCFHTFNRDGERVPYENITREVAVATLRRLAKTGEIYFDAPGEQD